MPASAPESPVVDVKRSPLRTTAYEQVRAVLLALILVLVGVVLVLAGLRALVPGVPLLRPVPIPIEIVEITDAGPAPFQWETPVDSPGDEIADTLELVRGVADAAALRIQQHQPAEPQPDTTSQNVRDSGRPRNERWIIRYEVTGSLEDYAAQLEFFDIELGAEQPRGKAVFLSQLAGDRPATRTIENNTEDLQLRMKWRESAWQPLDLQLCVKAGQRVRPESVFHAYPPQTEQLLARLEQEYEGRPPEQIRHTWFSIHRGVKPGQFTIDVLRQTHEAP